MGVRLRKGDGSAITSGGLSFHFFFPENFPHYGVDVIKVPSQEVCKVAARWQLITIFTRVTILR